MKFHHQRIIDPKLGDCWRTCVACILDLEPEQVPNVLALHPGDGQAQTDAMADFCRSRGYAMSRHHVKSQGNGWSQFDGLNLDALAGCLCVASVPSQRFPQGSHAVVGQVRSTRRPGENTWRTWVEIIHDPNPLNDPYPWFVSITDVEMLVGCRSGVVFPSKRQSYPEPVPAKKAGAGTAKRRHASRDARSNGRRLKRGR